MAKCKKCNAEGLEWVQDRGYWNLYNPDNGKWHNEECQKPDVSLPPKTAPKCKHGVDGSRLCSLCDEERRKYDDL